MTKGKSESRAGIPARAGHRSAKIAVYYKLRYPFNKLKRILRHSGIAAARKWAKDHSAEAALIRAKKALGVNNARA